MNEQLNSAVGAKQLNSAVGAKQLNSSVGTKQLNSSVGTKQFNSALHCRRPPATPCNLLQPPAPPLQQNRLFLSTNTSQYLSRRCFVRVSFSFKYLLRKTCSIREGKLQRRFSFLIISLKLKRFPTKIYGFLGKDKTFVNKSFLGQTKTLFLSFWRNLKR
ncbi:hypothetical protein TNCV_2923881 [Trichonephila clavipes]|nr:hypothetical protein TNCV_2923881 [Trichonephila clavipes]